MIPRVNAIVVIVLDEFLQAPQEEQGAPGRTAAGDSRASGIHAFLKNLVTRRSQNRDPRPPAAAMNNQVVRDELADPEPFVHIPKKQRSGVACIS